MCQEEWEKPAYCSSARTAAELQPGQLGTCLCRHDAGCAASRCPTPSKSADPNLGGTAGTSRAEPGCTALLWSLAVSCTGRRLTPGKQKMMAFLPDQLLDLVCRAAVYSVALAQQRGCERVPRSWSCLDRFEQPWYQRSVTIVLWFNPSQQLSTMQLLPHSPPPLPVGWGGELGKKVKLMR